MTKYFDGPCEGDESSFYHSYLLEGDSLIDGQEYSLLFKRRWRVFNDHCEFGGDNTYSLISQPFELVGGIREDESKKIWFKTLNFEEWNYAGFSWIDPEILGEEEHLLFDFELQVGDSIYCPGEGEFRTVVEIGEDFEGTGRRWINFNTHFWVAGVGGLANGIFSLYARDNSYTEFFPRIRLKCLKVDDVYIEDVFEQDEFSCDPETVSISELTLSKLKLFPNPMTTSAVLDLGDLNGPATIDIYDLSGKLISSQQQTAINGQLRLERGDLASGSYLLRVISEGEAIELPFVVD